MAVGFFRTASGWLVNVNHPCTSQVRLEDIARSLSRQCRFAGHLRSDVEIYSVAQHSVYVSHACLPQNALVGLLHDAPEAILQDIIKPNKELFASEAYANLEHGWAIAIGEAFGLGSALAQLPPDVKLADKRALATEQRDLVKNAVLDHEPYPRAIAALPLPSQSYQLFMERFEELIGVFSPKAVIS